MRFMNMSQYGGAPGLSNFVVSMNWGAFDLNLLIVSMRSCGSAASPGQAAGLVSASPP
jgi:hypothetical protein